jgi:hypothetical protein
VRDDLRRLLALVLPNVASADPHLVIELDLLYAPRRLEEWADEKVSCRALGFCPADLEEIPIRIPSRHRSCSSTSTGSDGSAGSESTVPDLLAADEGQPQQCSAGEAPEPDPEPDQDRPGTAQLGYVMTATDGSSVSRMPQAPPFPELSQAEALRSLRARLRYGEPGSTAPREPASAFSFRVRRFFAPLHDVLRLCWRVSVGRALRGAYVAFLAQHWREGLPPDSVVLDRAVGGGQAAVVAAALVRFEPAELQRNARAAADGVLLLQGEADSSQRRAAEQRAAAFAEAFVPAATLAQLTGHAASQAAATLLPVVRDETWARAAEACVRVVLAGSRLTTHSALHLALGLLCQAEGGARAVLPLPADVAAMNQRPAGVDCATLARMTAVARAAGAGEHAWRALGAAWEESCAYWMRRPPGWPIGEAAAFRHNPFTLFETTQLTGAFEGLSQLPRAAAARPSVRAAWQAMLAELCTRWFSATPYLVATRNGALARLEDTGCLARSTLL